MAMNGEVNTKFGIYRTLCCGQEIVISVGAEFPDCPRHPKLTTEWKTVIESDGVINLSELPAKNPTVAA
jgi:hypothetical protein